MPRQKQLTKAEVLDAINSLIAERGQPPTVEELRDRLGLGSTRTAHRYLVWLEEGGDIERWKGARGIRPLKASSGEQETIAVPVIGEVPAGPFLLAEENLQGYVRIPSSAAKGAEHFFLRVRGDSMDQAEVDGKRIESGDMVLVRRQQTAEHGDIVIALVDGQATVKEFAVGEGYYVLRPRSSKADYEPILVEDDFQIQGIVKRVYKGGTRFLLESVSD